MLSTKKKITAALSLGFVGALVLAGCSMGGETAAPESEPQTTETEEATPEMMADIASAAEMLVGESAA